MADPGSGPYVNGAFFCERTLREVDGTTSAIRMIDRITIQQLGGSTLGPTPPALASNPMPLELFVGLKSGSARGSHLITITMERPSGFRQDVISISVLFEGEERGVNLVSALAFQAEEEGLHWFDVIMEDRLLTRIPLRVVIQTQIFGGQ
jgi:hypothetical protein